MDSTAQGISLWGRSSSAVGAAVNMQNNVSADAQMHDENETSLTQDVAHLTVQQPPSAPQQIPTQANASALVDMNASAAVVASDSHAAGLTQQMREFSMGEEAAFPSPPGLEVTRSL